MIEIFTIIHIIESLGLGGAQSCLGEILLGFNKYHPEINQKVFLIGNRHDDDFIGGYGIEYTRIDKSSIYKRIKEIQSKEPVIVLFHKLMGSRTEICESFYNNNVPVVVVNHTYSSSSKNNMINKSDIVVCVSNDMNQMMHKQAPRHQYITIHNGVNGYRYNDIHPQARTNEEKDLFITGRVNALNSIKYSDSWIEWCSSVNLPIKMIHEYMGGGEFFNKAKNLVENLNNKKFKPKNEIKMLGPITDFNTKVSIIKKWDVFLYEINRNEGLSIAVLEALASGIPVICSNHGGNNEIILDGINGFIFDSRGDAVGILEELSSNPSLLAKLKQTTKEHFDKYLDAKIMVDKYFELFKEVINKDRNEIVIKKPDYSSTKIKPANFYKAKVKQRSNNNLKDKPQIQYIGVNNKKDKNMTENNEKFSILTANYNKGKYINEWAKSILLQSYRPLEVIFVDDASTDDTRERIMVYKGQFEEVGIDVSLIFNNIHVHCSDTYKLALDNASGFYFGILDSDDALTDGAVKDVVELYKKHQDVSWIYTQFAICDHNLHYMSRGYSKPPGRSANLLTLGKKGEHAYSHWRTFSKRFPQLDKIFAPGLTCAVDKYMGYRLEEFGVGLFTPKICYMYRGNVPGSISKVEQSRSTWYKIIDEATARRKKYNLKPFPILIGE